MAGSGGGINLLHEAGVNAGRRKDMQNKGLKGRSCGVGAGKENEHAFCFYVVDWKKVTVFSAHREEAREKGRECW